MIDEQLQEESALYATGVLSEADREQFAALVEAHAELRQFVVGFEEAIAATLLATTPANLPSPSAGLKARILAQLDALPQAKKPSESGFVITGIDGLVQWVNPVFTEMCGYTLEELRGRKLGALLQGSETDQATAARMRDAVHAHRPCSERILNYHKNGQPYWVEIAIQPIADSAGETRWFIAHERELTDLIAA